MGDCEDASYKRLIEALCAQNNIDIIQVNEREKLAEWAGLVKKDREGNIKKHFSAPSLPSRPSVSARSRWTCSCRSSRSKRRMPRSTSRPWRQATHYLSCGS